MMDPMLIFQALAALDDDSATRIISQTLQNRPELAPGVVNAAVPELTYAPVEALTKRRSNGVVKSFSPNGFGFISCPELKAVFGHDVYVHKNQIGNMQPGAEVNFAVLLSKDMKPQAFDLQSPAGGGCGPCGGCAGCFGGCGGCGACGGCAPGACGGGCGGDSWGCGGIGGMATMGGMMGKGQGCGKGVDAGSVSTSCLGGDDPAAKRLKGATPEPRPEASQIIGQFKGTIKSFDTKNGFGFIASQGLKDAGYANDVFLHRNQTGDCQPGMEVSFTAYLNKKGQPQSIDLVPVAKPGAQAGDTQGAQPVQVQGAQPAQGIQGAQAVHGLQGLQGVQAVQGLQALQCLQGIQSIPSMHGVPGMSGISGMPGMPGIPGVLGVQTLQAMQGVPGMSGVQGMLGVPSMSSMPSMPGLQVPGTVPAAMPGTVPAVLPQS